MAKAEQVIGEEVLRKARRLRDILQNWNVTKENDREAFMLIDDLMTIGFNMSKPEWKDWKHEN